MNAPPRDVVILVVEDDASFRSVLEIRLQREGYRVLTAADGREAMHAIVTQDPDLVLSDWMMPHVDGLELCQAVKTGLREAAPYFILLTAKGEISDQLLALETGADDYLVKPCDLGELMARVRAGLRNVTLTHELRHTHAQLHVAEHELAAAQAELSRVAELHRCPHCSQVTGDGTSWESLERYLERTGLLRLVPRGCPDCGGPVPGNGGALASSGRHEPNGGLH